jgi:glycosyltransferase involved in cell wall biosynthesis
MVYIFETHPVQYRAPLYREIQKMFPGRFKVVYATDCSVRGHMDREFKQVVSWDTPLLEGYPLEVLANEKGEPMTSWGSLTGRGVYRLLKKDRPEAVLLCQFFYQYSWAVFASAILLGIPVWIRQETQDQAFDHRGLKKLLRWSYYRFIYSFVREAFYIGDLNRRHLLRHGFGPQQLHPSPYCVDSPVLKMSREEKEKRRQEIRSRHGINPEDHVMGFFGKLIPKKDPMLLIEAWDAMPEAKRQGIRILFVGTGELEQQLRIHARERHIPAIFAGFINQNEISDYYLATDILVLPSKRERETWGLVVNEALHAGCGVVVTDAVGSSVEFGKFERFRTIPVGDAVACAGAIAELSIFPRSFDWAEEMLRPYTLPAVAKNFGVLLK